MDHPSRSPRSIRRRASRRRRPWLVVATLAISLVLPAAAPSSGGQVVGQPFEVPISSQPKYAVQAPSVDPDRQVTRLVADDGAELYLETWLPTPKDGHVPPQRLPTVLVATPYHHEGQAPAPFELLEPLVTRGYAYTRMHLRGTGGSSGCISGLDEREAQDIALAIEFVGHDAWWSNGRVGLSGLSWLGGSALNAVLRGDPERTRSVRAIEVAAPALSMYEAAMAHDGVPQIITGQGMIPFVTALGVANAARAGSVRPTLAERGTCLTEHGAAAAAHVEGSKTDYYARRDLRPHAGELDVPLLLFHGYEDYDPLGVLPIVEAGFFDRLPPDLPHVGVFGLWRHEYPVESGRPTTDLRLDVRRADAERMRIAWFDHYLRGIDAGADRWPQVQVQSTDGRWRVLDRWPTPSGTAARLALGPDGSLGTSAPSGSTTYLEGELELKTAAVPGTEATFVTPALRDRLELTGVATADLWVVLERPDSHVVVTLEALDANGEPIAGARTWGARSAQHLDPIVDGRFTQADPVPAPTGAPLPVPVRLNPTQLVVPEGGRLRLTVTGMANVTEGIGAFGAPDPVVGEGTQPSGVVQTVTVLHDCQHTSALRFTVPDGSEFLTVRRLDPADPTSSIAPTRQRFPRPAIDGGGLATAPICGGGNGSYDPRG